MRIRTLAAALAALGMTGAQAAGFALIEQNASGLGNAYAGQAATAQDASTIFFNPAGLTELKGAQIVGALHAIRPQAEYTSTAGVPSGGDAGGLAWVPNFYYARQLGGDLSVGVGVNSPFGLKTEYDAGWAGRAHGILSDLKTINLNPSLAWRANDRLSLGLGVNVQYIEAELTNFVGVTAKVTGDDISLGWNLGLLYRLDDASRLGIGYRSKIKHKLEGSLVTVATTPAYAEVTLPDTVSLAYFRQLDDHWSVNADLTWTGWSVFENLTVRSLAGATLSNTPENWQVAWRVGLGASYKADDQMTWRFGVAFDETPVPDVFRTPRIPDEDRFWLALGGQYRLSGRGSVDFGYAHLFVKDAGINLAPLNGSYDNAVDILSIQYTHQF